MMKTGMLLISNPSVVFRALPIIQNEVSNTIYIHFFPTSKWAISLSVKSDSVKNLSRWPNHSSTVIGLYSKLLPLRNVDVRVLLSGHRSNDSSRIVTKTPVDVVYYDQLLSREEVIKYVGSCVQNKNMDFKVIALPNHPELDPSSEEYPEISTDYQIYDNVVLGGTFDRLHYGHKILLSEAVLHCRKKITVGVTDIKMLKGKKLWELIQPCDMRIQKVKDFLEEVEPALEYNIVPINDIYGPTKDDPTFQMIVVSAETVNGGSKINEIRVANQLNPLCIRQVELLADVNKEDEEEEDKISSSNLRLRCLGTLLRPPQQNPSFSQRPYIIGLTGGIASGKTNISKQLEALGASVINCDLIAHHIYRVGAPGHAKVVEQFGLDILDEKGVIDRAKLGQIVFNDKAKLQVLNNLVWPLMLEEVLSKAHQEDSPVVVLEAAVLIMAGWTKHCHEIWVSIIPPEEAIKRVMVRNNLTDEQAAARVASQPCNMEQVRHANVVFSTLWRTEFTQKQVTKAWTGLLQRLNIKN